MSSCLCACVLSARASTSDTSPQEAGSRRCTPHLRTSAAACRSPAVAAATAIWHMQPTMAAVDELSAPPDSGSRKPAALRNHAPSSQCAVGFARPASP
jgi:hypothetical protein